MMHTGAGIGNVFSTRIEAMSELMDMLRQSLGEEGVATLSQRIGADPNKTKDAIGAALPALIGALSRKGANSDGASGLLQMLDRDGDGDILDDVMGYLSGSAGKSAGGGLLEQVLGGGKDRVQQNISKSSGLDAGSVKDLLDLLAPMVVGAAAKQKKTHGFDADRMKDYLGTEHASVEKQTGGLIGKLLDQDGDGDFDLSDVAKLAMGKLFGKQ
jgi:hypothetical protein